MKTSRGATRPCSTATRRLTWHFSIAATAATALGMHCRVNTAVRNFNFAVSRTPNALVPPDADLRNRAPASTLAAWSAEGARRDAARFRAAAQEPPRGTRCESAEPTGHGGSQRSLNDTTLAIHHGRSA